MAKNIVVCSDGTGNVAIKGHQFSQFWHGAQQRLREALKQARKASAERTQRAA